MSDLQLRKLISEAQALATELRQLAANKLEHSGKSADPFERGEAVGTADALSYSAQRLEALAAGYITTKPLAE
jgi:hypothetical protein